MSLKKYEKKRDFAKSPEPKGSLKRKKNSLNFCIQKHAASHLHYDFRLEYKGILLSWAIPKGPSLNPKDKRLAIKVEDHPLEYQYFEGVIPKGNYGAGTVEIWDHGTYTVPNSKNTKDVEKALTEGLKRGHFEVILSGNKISGVFVFQQLKTDNKAISWLFIKKNKSHEVAAKTITTNDLLQDPQVKKLGKKAAIPDFISPMLATSMLEPFDDDQWLFELKWDGFRSLAIINPPAVQLKSRSKHLLNDKFKPIENQLKKIHEKVIFDGELVVLDNHGMPKFQLMQNYQKTDQGNLYYYVFDLLYKDGRDLRSEPLIVRKKLLKECLEQLSLPLIRYSDHVLKEGESFFKEVVKQHIEGMMAKKISSTYQSRRSHDWIKIKTKLRQEFVIGGFTAPRGSRKKFGALLVGVYEGDKLKYAGHVGGGFNSDLLNDIYIKLEKLIQTNSPFEQTPKPNAKVTWVKPKLLCEVSFAEWTKDDIMRQPIFEGLRNDKPVSMVKKEIPIQRNEKQEKNTKLPNLVLTNQDKIYWPQEGITKGDILEYYRKISPFLLPYLKDRPIMLHRFPDGIEGVDFYQKDMSLTHPKWIETCSIHHNGKIDHYLLINDLESLLYAVNLGSIEIHPFITRQQSLENPDYCVIDLDPHDIAFTKLVEVALYIHEILENVQIRHYCKTSGAKGLHICIPLHAKYTYEQSKQFAEIIAMKTNKKFLSFTSLERDPKKRPRKIYLDCLQNRKGQTIVAPYSVRPQTHASVSTPLLWEEVNENLDPSKFNIKTIFSHLSTEKNSFKKVLGVGINMRAALAKLKSIP